MAWKFSSDKLIYLQIAERIILSVISGEYAPGAQIPSVRQLALMAAVNPNTVQHAFAELENEGVIISKGTVGRYVTDDTEIIENCRKKTAEQTVNTFVDSMQTIGLEKDEIMKMLEERLI